MNDTGVASGQDQADYQRKLIKSTMMALKGNDRIAEPVHAWNCLSLGI
jgi:hypothetical protein